MKEQKKLKTDYEAIASSLTWGILILIIGYVGRESLTVFEYVFLLIILLYGFESFGRKPWSK